MEKLFVSVQIAQLLKQKGFNEPCIKYIYQGDTANNTDVECECIVSKAKDWNNEILCVSIPMYSQVIEWFRDWNNLIVEVKLIDVFDINKGYSVNITHVKYNDGKCCSSTGFNGGLNYNEALIESIKETLKFIK